MLGDLELPKRGYADQFYQLARLELDHAEKVMKLGSMQADMLFDHVRRIARIAKDRKVPLRVVELVPAGDQTFAASFEVVNPLEQPADLRFVIPTLRSANGDDLTGLRCVASCRGSVASGVAATVTVTATGPVTELAYGEIEVFASAETEKRVAHRALKVRPNG